ncbi:MAG TPA: hypothetical protein VMW35_10520 [Myxococcota bacterium]|nr:hypothetical protein [Myxococcota bacterium]
MAESPVFQQTVSELALEASLEPKDARSTLRRALAAGGLDAGTVRVGQMLAVLRHLLPAALRARGVGAAETICTQLVERVARMEDRAIPDAVQIAEATFARFGSGGSHS